jgi:tetratricopeptide (TPR) repeat protein
MKRIIFSTWIFAFLLLSIPPGFVRGQEYLPSLIKRIEPSTVVIFALSEKETGIGQGTGFFISPEGDVITNYHVLQGASRAIIKVSSGAEYPVKAILGADREVDLVRVAVDIPPEEVHPLPISRTLPEVGERVVIIGTPMGLDKTVSDGIVSAIRRVPDFGEVIQLTAPISQGSSGSPVFNMKGEVVGVATFFVIMGQNLNFAIPGTRILRLATSERKTLPEWQAMSQKERQAEAEAAYQIGLRYLWLESCERAIPFFEDAILKDSRHFEAASRAGYCWSQLKEFTRAIPLYQRAIQLKPQDASLYNNLCMAYGAAGDTQSGILACQKAIELKRDLAEAHSNLAWLYHRNGRYFEAIASCKEAIRLNPDFAQAHYNLGNNYSAMKRYEEAAGAYKQAIRLDFNYAEAHLNLGAAYNQMGRFEEAVASYKQAVRLKPLLPEVHLNLGMTYLKMGDRGSALEEFKILKDLNQDMANKLFNLIYE